MIAGFYLLAAAAIIYFACDYFVNAVEWLGRSLHFNATAIGSVLAALGTALPESAITGMAVVLGRSAHEKDVGVGAAMGGPLVLATLAYAVVGVGLLYSRRQAPQGDPYVHVNNGRLAHDQASFLFAFVAKVTLGVTAFAYKPYTAILFLAYYAFYVWRELANDDDGAENEQEEPLEPLRFRPKDVAPSWLWSGGQMLVMLIIIAGASHVFVAQLEAVGRLFELSPHLVALVLSPVATELPEIMNASIWVRQGKERLALANISGSMMIQATVPSALGIYFTPWQFDRPLLIAGIVTTVAIAYLGWHFRRGPLRPQVLLGGLPLYAGFVIYLVLRHFGML
jgi:cation:H+ antiporter